MRLSQDAPLAPAIADPRPAPLRIGVLTHIQHPIRQPFAGGLEAFTYDVTLGLRSRGHAVTLFASSDSAAELKVVPVWSDDNYGADGRRTKRPCLSSLYLDEHHAYLRVMQGIDDHGFDLIFNNSLHYVPPTMASVIRTPMLTVLHTPPFFELRNALRADRRTGMFCTVSAANARNWQEIVGDCPVIENGIDLVRWSPQGTPGQHALWFGRLVPDKGAHLALDAARAAGIELRLAGQAVDERYFREQIQPRLGAGAHYLGHLQRDALRDEVAAAAVVAVTPCWDEPFGLVVAEALACGTPVAGFARGALVDLIHDDCGALCAPDDVEGLAVALRQAREKSREACRRHAERHWCQARMLDRYEALMRSLVAQHA